MQIDDGAGRAAAFLAAWRRCRAAAGVERSVLLASTFRSGSTRIAWNLAENGVPALDQERFAGMWQFAEAAEPGALATSLGAIFATCQGGRFTSKVMWPHLRYLFAAAGLHRQQAPALAALFAPAVWIHVVRRDKIAQAISFWRAKQSGRWHVFEAEPEPAVTYDYRAILDCLQEQAQDDRLWEDFFALCGVVPIRVTYEAYEADVEGQLRALLAATGQPVAGSLRLEVPLRRQRDAASAELRERFLGDLYRFGLPAPAG